MEQKIDQILKTVTDTQGDIKSIQSDLCTLKTENKEIRQKLSLLENKFKKLEKSLKQNDLIIYGMEEAEHESVDDLEQKCILFINDFIKVRIAPSDIQIIKRIGAKNNKRPVMVKFLRHRQKLEIWQNRKQLINSGYAISDNYTEDILETRNKLKPYLLKAREDGKRAVINYDKLFIDGKKYTLDDLQKELQSIQERPELGKQLITKKQQARGGKGSTRNLRNK